MCFVDRVLRLIGEPLLHATFRIGENVFLNHKIEGKKGLELIGDWFLTPSRYLFGGKTITKIDVENNQIETKPSCDYKKNKMMKTILSILALPFAWLFGSICKGLSYLSAEKRREHNSVQYLLDAPIIRSQEEFYQKLGIGELRCNQIAPCQNIVRPELTSKQKIEIEALADLSKLLNSNGITWWVDCGTALGTYRHAGMIPWDFDVDAAILSPDHENVKSVLKQLPKDRYEIQDWSPAHKPGTLLKLYVKESNSHLDLYHYDIQNEENTVIYNFPLADSWYLPQIWKLREIPHIKPFKYEMMFPLKKASFDGIDVWVPNQLEDYLKAKYGQNIGPARIWNQQTQQYDKVLDHPYWQQSHI